MSSPAFLQRLPIDGFLLAMLSTVLLASLYPALGASHGALHLEQVTTVGIGLVFLLSGIGLSTDQLKLGARNWRLHLFVQSSTFLLFPLIGILVMLSFGRLLPHDLLVGFFFLCALSSTVSTSIAMTTLARGNVAAAVFNATVSSLIGMLITPLLVSVWLHASGQGLSLQQQLLGVAEQLLLPFLAGQLLRPLVAGWVLRYQHITGKVDRAVILLIVYNSFCDSTQAGLWRNYGAVTLLQTLLLVGGLLAIVLSLTTFCARRFGFSTEDEITVVFCGSKKSLATGMPMAKLLFGGSATGASSLGLIVLPIMFYHQLQLLVCSVIARRYAQRKQAPAATDPTTDSYAAEARGRSSSSAAAQPRG
ncbi:MAG: na+-dependent transporter protein [Nevskia sp.]|nr:na+-dependent transporter protein [Nevskia sp.]